MNMRFSILATFVILILLLGGFPLHGESHGAGNQGWEPLGPDGGPVGRLLIYPNPPYTLYALTTRGALFRSDDGGKTWHNTLASNSVTGMTSLALHPQSPDILYAGDQTGGIFKSDDRGETWRQIFQVHDWFVHAISFLTIDPLQPRTIYATSPPSVYKSDDDGVTWTKMEHLPDLGFDNIILGLYPSPTRPNALYLFSTKTLYKSLDGGVTWHLHDFTTDRHMNTVLTVAPGPTEDLLLLGAINQVMQPFPNVYISDDGGVSWRYSGGGLPDGQRVYALAPHPDNASILYAGLDTGVYRLKDEAWAPMNQGIEQIPTYALAAFPHHASTLLAGTSQGVFRCESCPGRWRESNSGISARPIRKVVPAPSQPTTLYALGATPFRSDDSGESWTRFDMALEGDAIRMLAVDPQTAQRVYLATDQGVYLSEDGAESWRPITTGLTVVDTFSIAVDPMRPGVLYAGTREGLFRSRNGGATWSYVDTQYTFIPMSLAVDPAAPQRIFAGSNGSGLFLSEDDGWTWRHVRDVKGAVRAIVIDAVSPNRMYVCTYDKGLYRSVDGGSRWRRLETGIEGLEVRDLAIDPLHPHLLYLATEEGVFQSEDGGDSWRHFDANLSARDIQSLAMTPLGDRLYAGSLDGGVWAYGFFRPLPHRYFLPFVSALN